jgi:hypothetical protein
MFAATVVQWSWLNWDNAVYRLKGLDGMTKTTRNGIRAAWILTMVMALLLPMNSLAASPQAIALAAPVSPADVAARAGCAQAKLHESGATARWLESCGSVAAAGDPEKVARGVLSSRSALLGLRADGSDLDLLNVAQAGDVTYVRFGQTHRGIPVYQGQTVVQYTKAGAVQLINNHTLPNLSLDVTPAVGKDAALVQASAAVAGSDQLRLPLERELVVYGAGAAPQLAWHIVMYTQAPLGDWHVMVSASTGKVLGSWNEIQHDSGTGLVYHPNAIQQTGTTTLVDNNDATSAALDSARVSRPLNNLSAATNQLKGAAVDITAPGVTGCSLPYVPGQANEASRTYNYTRDDDRFEEAAVYAAIDGIQTWFQALGFTNVNNRSIPVDVHCITDDNSYYSSGDKALHFGDGGVDDAEDADIAIHEYGHSVHDNQVPGWGGGGGNNEQRAMGEGFGDFLAGMYYINDGNATFLNTYKYCIGEWDASGYNPIVAGNSGSGCLRWINGRSQSNGADIGAYSGTPTAVHSDGRFWSAALTCVYEGMGGNAAAREDITEIVLAHHFSLTPDSSNDAFEDAVAALVTADQARLGGTHTTLINNCALARGLITAPVVPQLAAPTLTYPDGGEELPTSTSVNVTWNTNGAPATATYTVEYTSDCNTAAVFSDTVENGANGWTASHAGGSEDWAQVTSESHSPTHAWFASNTGATNDQYLVSPNINVPAGSELSFWHRYDLEAGYDGGLVEISTNGGTTWTDLGSLMTLNGYSGTIDNPIGDRPAFTGTSAWIETRANLASFGGQTVKLRFRQADDSSESETGWWVDDIAVRASTVWTVIGTSAAGASSLAWTTPATAGTDYCIRIKGQAPNFTTSAYSTGTPFSLVAGTPTLAAPTLTYPDGGESIATSTSVNITWNTNGAPGTATYTVEYNNDCTGGPGTWTVIGTSAAGASSLAWTTPATAGTDYCVRIKGQAPGFTASAYSTGTPFALVTSVVTYRIYLPLLQN